MPFSDEMEKPIGHMSNGELLYLIILGILTMAGTIYFGHMAITVGGTVAVLFAVECFLIAPYCYAAGNKETHRPPLGFYLKCLFWWAVMIGGCWLGAEFLIEVIKPLLLSVFL